MIYQMFLMIQIHFEYMYEVLIIIYYIIIKYSGCNLFRFFDNVSEYCHVHYHYACPQTCKCY